MATSDAANAKLKKIQVADSSEVDNKFNTEETILSTELHELVNNDAADLRPGDDDEVMAKYRSFKSFDTVEDFSDHYYKSKSVTKSKQTSQKWAKAIQKDWRLLEKDLPDTIFVRTYEERMDLLRAVIVGAAGTPYHDGLFFFDVFYPPSYPDKPPHVKYHAHNLQINPNLNKYGDVCLSLLNTWKGDKVELWTPGLSTMLQVLLSIQALVLNEKPWFNEAGNEIFGEEAAQDYNQSTFIRSCRTMLYTLKNPPKYFEDYVMGHFRLRAYNILAACKAYIEGAQVGSVVEQVQDESEKRVTEGLYFKSQVGIMVGRLVPIFISKGAKNCEQFICLGDQAAADESQTPYSSDYYSSDYYSSDNYSDYSSDYSPDQSESPAPAPVQAQFRQFTLNPRAQPFTPKPAQDQSQPSTHSLPQFQPLAYYPAQPQFQPLAHYPAQPQFQLLAHYPAQPQFRPLAHYPAQAQFRPLAHPQAQFQPLTYSPAQVQPLARHPAQLQPLAHPFCTGVQVHHQAQAMPKAYFYYHYY